MHCANCFRWKFVLLLIRAYTNQLVLISWVNYNGIGMIHNNSVYLLYTDINIYPLKIKCLIFRS